MDIFSQVVIHKSLQRKENSNTSQSCAVYRFFLPLTTALLEVERIARRMLCSDGDHQSAVGVGARV